MLELILFFNMKINPFWVRSENTGVNKLWHSLVQVINYKNYRFSLKKTAERCGNMFTRIFSNLLEIVLCKYDISSLKWNKCCAAFILFVHDTNVQWVQLQYWIRSKKIFKLKFLLLAIRRIYLPRLSNMYLVF